MKKCKQFMVLSLGLLVLVGGCGTDAEQKKKAVGEEVKEKEIIGSGGAPLVAENFVRVQDYTGEGYALRDGEKTDKIAEEHKAEIENAVKDYFLEEHKTEVVVHNLVGAKDGVSVFVESVGEPHFYTFAIVPIDVKTGEVKTDQVWSQEGQVEMAIASSLYGMVYKEEFAKLDAYLEGIIEEYPVIGLRVEVLENVGARAFANSYYMANGAYQYFNTLYQKYIENPRITEQELLESVDLNSFDLKYMTIGITLYMEEENVEPDEALYDKIVEDIKQMEGIPRGSYMVILHDNLINKVYASAEKENSITKTVIEPIIKE